MKNVAIWIRVSTEDQAQGDSPAHHEQRAHSYADAMGWNVVEVYHLEAVSGKSVMEHPETVRMLADVRAGRIQGLVFSKLARLARNTRELLEFADIFRKNQAGLISLEENIDTSSPAGRLFYTLIAAMAEWEREEIAGRVRASVKVRAKLGKPLGGEAPFGYQWDDKELVLNKEEAPVRKLIHELFTKHKRKRKVASILNEKGYRTRRGSKFSDTSIDRMLRDPIAKGMRRVNYTESTGDGKHWKLKPQDEWIFIKAPRIISDELWDACNHILDEMAKKHGKVRRKGVHLFSGIVQCECGSKMYMRSTSPKYVCQSCKNKIAPDDLEEIFHGQLKDFLFSDTEIQNHLNQEKQNLDEKEKLLETRKRDLQKAKERVANILELYHEGDLTKIAFKEHHTPAHDKQIQIEQSIDELQGSIDALKMQSLDNSQLLFDAQNLHKQWQHFTKEEKKRIIETITESVIVGKEDIEINLSYIPTLVEKKPNYVACQTKHYYPVKTMQLCNATTWVRCIVVKLKFLAKRPVNPAYPKELVTLGDHLRKVRLDRGISQPAVAKLLNVTPDTITYWELNRHIPTAKDSHRIVQFLGYLPWDIEQAGIDEKVKILKILRGKNQRELAKELGCDVSSLRLIERKERTPGSRIRSLVENGLSAALVAW